MNRKELILWLQQESWEAVASEYDAHGVRSGLKLVVVIDLQIYPVWTKTFVIDCRRSFVKPSSNSLWTSSTIYMSLLLGVAFRHCRNVFRGKRVIPAGGLLTIATVFSNAFVVIANRL